MAQIDKRNGKWIDFRVDENAILDNAIKSRHIAPDTVVAADIAPDAVGSEEIADGAVITARIADNAVTSDKIAPGAVGSEEIAENTDVSYKGFNADMVDGLHASEIGAPSLPYTGDETEVYTVGSVYESKKTFRFIKHGSVLDPGSMRIGCELKCTAGSYDMGIYINGTGAATIIGQSTDYEFRYIDIGLGTVAQGIGSVDMMLRCISSPGTAYNRLFDVYLIV